MKIYVIYRGPFGEQMINNLATKGFADKLVCLYELKHEAIEEEHSSETDLWTKIWEYPEKYVPKNMPLEKCDLLLVLGIHPKLGDLVPPIAEKLGAKAVLYPIDDRDHAPEAKKTIEEDLKAKRIHVEFPEPFCLLNQSENNLVDQFAEKFGRPKFEIELDQKKKIIKEVKVIRDTPCGSASCVAQKILRYPYDNITSFGKKIFDEHSNEGNENYCLAEMDPINPLMQEAGDLLKEAIYEACGFTTYKDVVLREIREREDITVTELQEIVVDQMKLCEAKQTIERYIKELAEQGKIVKTVNAKLKLT